MAEITQLRPDLFMICTGFPQVYLWRDGSEITMIDAGFPGDEPDLAAAFEQLGLAKASLRRLVLTHHHEDHTGAAADITAWGDVEVIAHQADARIIRGQDAPPARNLTEHEREIFAKLSAGIPPAPPCRVDSEVATGDVIAFGGGARVISAAGHTAGSMALLVESAGVLFTGDLIGNRNGLAMGHFNDDPALARQSFVALAQTPATLICFGHGTPLSDPQAWTEFGAQILNDAAA